MKKKIIPYILLLIPVILVSCSSSHSSQSTGTLGFSLVLKAQTLSAAQIDCTATGIATIEAVVYDSSGISLATGGPWACSQHSGTISGIPAGNNRKIVINTRDASGNILYRAEKTGITITAGQSTDSGTLTLIPFIFWSVNTIDTSGNMGLYTAIAHDSSNKIHIAYYDATNKGLKYTTNASGVWVTTSVDVDPTRDVGQYPSIAVDSGNKVHISYYDATNKTLKYATNSSGSWVAVTILDSGDVGQYSRIAVDGSGNVHISYYNYIDASNGHLKYATNSSGSWVTETVDTTNYNTGQYSSLAVAAGKVHISYYDATNGYLMYVNNVSGAWSTPAAVDNGGSTGRYSSIAVDSAGHVHISYYDGSNGDLKYATNATPTNTWVSTVIDAHAMDYVNYQNYGHQFGTYTSIAVDANNNVHISYHEMTYNWGSYGGYNYLFNLKYATNSSGTWITYRVDLLTSQAWYDGSKDAGWDSITVDSNNKVHISYYNIDGACLKYATSAGSSWSTNTIDVGENVGQYSSLAVDSSNNTYISYYDAGQGDLKYATKSSGGAWTTTSIDTAGNVGQYSSIAVDSNKHVHISYYDPTRQTLRYATNSLGSWATYTVDSDGNVGEYTSIAVDSSNKVHISYYDVTNGNLKYVTKASSGSWSTPEIVGDGLTDYGYYTAIAVDSSGNAYIAYADASGHLKFATNAPSGTWTISTVDTGTTTNAVQYQYTSLKLDASANAYISYYDVTNGDLKYATNSSGWWVTTTLDSAGNVGQFSSLARDGAGKIHISYYDATNGDLRYATNYSGSWLIYTLDSGGDVGEYTSMAVDGSNNLHISYYDATNQDLRYTSSSAGAGGTLSDQDVPSIPAGLAATTNRTNTINLTWTASSDVTGVSGYYIYRDGAYLTSSPTNSFSDAGLVPGANHCYAVAAFDTANNQSDQSNTACAVIPIYANAVSEVSLKIDANNKVHIAYRDQSSNAILYTNNTLGSWQTSTVVNDGLSHVGPELALDAGNHAHIVYASPTSTYSVTYTTNTSGSWQSDLVDQSTSTVLYPANIAIGPGNIPHIVYGASASVRHAVYSGGIWTTEPVDAASSYLQSIGIAVDGSGFVHAAYRSSTNGGTRYATNAPSGSWVATDVDPSGDGISASLALDSNGKVHIAYYDYGNTYDLKYATYESTSWVVSTIDSGTVYYSQMALGPNNAVHIGYVTGSGDIKYATNASGTWQTKTIIKGSGLISIAVDSAGKAHIAYTSDGTNSGLYYMQLP